MTILSQKIKGVLTACSVATLFTSSVSLAASTTVGTRQTLSQPNTVVTSNSGAKWSSYSRAPNYAGAKTLPLQFITTSTGEKLAVFVSVPTDANGNPVPGKFPVVLTQTAYRIDMGQLAGGILPADTTLLIGGLDKYMVTRGYITVAVDVLGSGMSSGVSKLLSSEEQAAYGEAVKWVNNQPWFDGNIGVAGTSYLGITSLFTAAQQHPSVKAAFAIVPMGDAYRGTVGPGGLLNANFISLWMALTQNLSVANDPAKLLYPQYAAQIAAANQQHIDAINQWYLPTVNNALAGTPGYATDDGNFWGTRSPVEVARNIRVPTFIIGGSNDIFQRDAGLLYEQMKNNVTTKLVVAPGAHAQALLSSLVNHNNSINNGAPDAESLLLQWFDQYVKGYSTGAASLPNVTQYVQGYGLLGTERYASTTDWPHPQMTAKRFYLHGNLALNSQSPGGFESTRSVKEAPSPTISISTINNGTMLSASLKTNDGSACSNSQVQWTLGIAGFLPLPCYNNDTTVESAQNALVYDTPMQWSDMYLNGPIQADIWMSSNTPHAALAVRVDDVDLLGVATPLTTGLQSAAHRQVDVSRSRIVNGTMIQPWHPFTASTMQPLVPGQPVLVRVEVFPTAALIRAGHKLRVAISSSNQAEAVWPYPQQAAATGNVTTIYHDAAHPSSIVLPVVPTSAL